MNGQDFSLKPFSPISPAPDFKITGSIDRGADILAIGTELAKTTQRPEWAELIATARAAFPGETTHF